MKNPRSEMQNEGPQKQILRDRAEGGAGAGRGRGRDLRGGAVAQVDSLSSYPRTRRYTLIHQIDMGRAGECGYFDIPLLHVVQSLTSKFHLQQIE